AHQRFLQPPQQNSVNKTPPSLSFRLHRPRFILTSANSSSSANNNVLLTSPLPLQTLSDPSASFSFCPWFATLLRAESMFIPLKDINPSRSYPFVNISLIVANMALFFYELSLQFSMAPKAYAAFLTTYSTVPARLPAFFAGHGTF